MKNLMFYAFIALCLVQLYVPAKMILGQEEILSEGTAFKFKTRPIDPNDPFRGKYIWLNYEADKFNVGRDEDWQNGETVFVHLENDDAGYAKIANVTREEPEGNIDYLKTNIQRYYQHKNRDPYISINYPFDRFYMEESKALEAEQSYAETRRDTAKLAYGLVYIQNGNAVLKDVILDGVPIQEVVEKERILKGN